DGTPATVPIVSANMNAVTGPRLAAALARRGGLSILPQDLPLQELDAALRWVKSQPVGFDTAVELRAHDTVAAALAQVPPTAGYGVVVTDEAGELLGAIAAERLAAALRDARL